jgi:hypothetical protein
MRNFSALRVMELGAAVRARRRGYSGGILASAIIVLRLVGIIAANCSGVFPPTSPPVSMMRFLISGELSAAV